MSAPLDLAALQSVLLPFGPSRLLPQGAYTSPEVLEWEKQHFFEGSWVCAGTAEGLAKPGDQKAVRVGRDGVLLVRGDDNVIRGFFNVCRHRAHELLQVGECSQSRSIRCPYHGWNYDLDGSLKASVAKSHTPGFDPSGEGLVPARVEVWHGWIFVNASGDAPPLKDWVGDLEEIAAPYEPERLKIGVTHSYEIASNWKLATENYHECYHCPQIHPQLCRVSPPDSGDNQYRPGAWVGGTMDLIPEAVTMSMDGHSDGVFLRGLKGDLLRTVQYYGLFPNVLLELSPRLHHDPSDRGARAQPEPHRVPMALRPRVVREAGLRPQVRRGLLGHDQLAGLARGGERAARHRVEGLSSGNPHAPRGRGLPVRDARRPGIHRGSLRPGAAHRVRGLKPSAPSR